MSINVERLRTTSARSVVSFGVYLAFVGLTLLVIPNIFLTWIGVQNTSEVWIRLSGILLMALSIYYVVAALHALAVIYKVTVYVRSSIILFFAAFVHFGFMEPVMLLFAGLDLAGAAWTYVAMRREGIW